MNTPAGMDVTSVTIAATEHAYRVRGLITFLRDTADQVHALAEKGAPICTGEAAGWVIRLDTIGNALAESSDNLSDTMRAAGMDAPLALGNLTQRENT
jgi:hypothetical protein